MRALLAVAALAALALSGCSSCADLSVARPFPCDRSIDEPKQCPENWRCGLLGTCFDADAGAGQPNVCENSALDCSDGWRCGAADSLNKRHCQRIGVGGPYPCQDNADCEADWRCDPVGHACALAPDQLQVSKLSGLLVDQVSPTLPDGEPRFAAVGPLQALMDFTDFRSGQGRVLGLVSDGGLYVVTQFDNARPGDGGWPRVAINRYDVDDAALVQLGTVGERVLGVFADGRLLAWDRRRGAEELLDRGARGLVSLGAGQQVQRDSWEVAVLRPDDVLLLSRDGRRFPIALDAGATIAVTGDLTAAWVLGAQSFDTYSLTTDAGPTLESRVAPTPPLPAIARLSLGGTGLLVELAPDAGPSPTARWAFAEQSLRLPFRYGPCEVCPFGAEPLQVRTVPDDPSGLRVRCPAVTDAGLPIARTWQVSLRASGCAETRFNAVEEDEAPYQFGFVSGTSTSAWRAHAGKGGRAWYDEDADPFQPPTVPPLHPVVLDRQPDFLGRLEINGVSSVAAVAGAYSYSHSVAGLVSELRPNTPGELSVAGTVAGASELLITSQGVYNLRVFPLGGDRPQQIAALGPGVPELSAPASGTLVPISEGRRVLVIASRDTLYAAEVSQQLSMDAGVNGSLLPPALLAQRLVPAPGVPIRDVALGELSTSNSASRADGSFYVLARDAVFGIAMLDLESWEATPIPLPAEFGAPRELWTEGGRGRVAYKSGHISALPTAVQLAPALPDGEATDFARLCGDTIAVVGDGLRRFASDAGWVPVPGVQFASDAGVRLYESGPSTLLATGTGHVLELTPRRTDAGLPACP